MDESSVLSSHLDLNNAYEMDLPILLHAHSKVIRKSRDCCTMVRSKFLSHTCAFHRHVKSKTHIPLAYLFWAKRRSYVCVAYSLFVLHSMKLGVCIARDMLQSRSSVNWTYFMSLSMCEKQKSMLPCQTQFHVSTPIPFRCIVLTASTYNSLWSFLILATQHLRLHPIYFSVSVK